jgi:hypothetical protein
MLRAHRKISYFPLALLTAALVGLGLGSAFPERVHAANFWQFWAHIPVGSGFGQTVYMNCGWHSGACAYPFPSGISMDWEETNSNAYFAGAGWWDNWWVENAAYALATYQPGFNGSSCKNVVANIYNWHTNQYLAREVYTHVSRSGSKEITIYAYSTPWGVRESVGSVVAYGSELSGCSHFGTHVHNYGMNFGDTNEDGFWDAVDCNDDACESYDNGTWVHWEGWYY